MGDKQTGIGKWFHNLTAEERAAHHIKLQEGRKKAQDARRKLKQTAHEKALELLPEILAKEMIAEKEYQPTQEVVTQLKELISKGYSTEQMRSGPFKNLPEKTWSSLVKHLFKSQVGQIEDLGVLLLQARKDARRRLEKRGRMIRKEMKEWKKKGRIPPKLFSELGSVENELHKIEIEMTKTMHQVEAVGEKNKGTAINLHFNTPRPKALEETAIDVTPK